MRLAIFLLAVGCSAASQPAECTLPDGPAVQTGVAQDQPTDVPLTAAKAADGALRFSVPMRVGDRDLQVWLDSGSPGLRILPRANVRYDSITSTPVGETYESGISLDGVVAFANVTFGDRTTASPIAVMKIDEVRCARQQSSR